MLESLTLVASSIRVAERLTRQLTVNQIAHAVLNDQRDAPPLKAAQPAPHRPQRGKAHEAIMVGDYLKLTGLLAEVTVKGVEARASGDLETAARLERRAATLDRILDDLQRDIQDATAPRVRAGHRTRYLVTVPSVQYVHPEFGPHASSPASAGVIDFQTLTGEDWEVFTAFRRDFPQSGKWPLYAPDRRDGLQKTKRHAEQAEPVRALLDAFLAQHPELIPPVTPLPAQSGPLENAGNLVFPVPLC